MIDEKLTQLIDANNAEYEHLLHQLILQRKNGVESDIKLAKHHLWQHVHNYATNISDLLIQNPTELTNETLDLLDLVNSRAWQEIDRILPDKIKIIIKKVRESDAIYHNN